MLKKLFSLLGKKGGSSPKKRKKGRSKSEWVPKEPNASPEELCGIDPNTMSKDTIRKQLAILYKRHNSAVSSLNPELRKEAAHMLHAIVECRERYVDAA